MNKLSHETILQQAIQLVCMDAIEKGHIKHSEIIEYMKTERFKTAVNGYVMLIHELEGELQ